MSRSHKQCKLSYKLQTYSDTRFNGAFITMDIFLLVFDEMISVLDSSFINYYLLVDKELSERVCSFLKAFGEVLEEMSNDKVPTIYKVLPLREYLLNHCKLNPDDHDGIKEIKTFLELRIKNVWVLHDVHYITSLLHPSFKDFRINPDLKTKAIDLVKNAIWQKYLLSTSNGSAANVAPFISTSTSDTQLTTSNSLLSKCFDSPRENR
ncbi:unnamed protein product [Rotaria sp. Silwood2]|nr:unnamed protein product [Rotaria sp. Silwood2]CAF2967683.1 unnamed protein product [Rotaria sp. Silwood2]CAF2999525.1 unnamed protein product [Rotaria sp. Silwood2]CAF3321569.1 unnamed protein product [Rotaria sp. Silwood2]CAF3952832.1 unnamed protein product [Rotaria sp. Silwood2]